MHIRHLYSLAISELYGVRIVKGVGVEVVVGVGVTEGLGVKVKEGVIVVVGIEVGVSVGGARYSSASSIHDEGTDSTGNSNNARNAFLTWSYCANSIPAFAK